MKKMLDYLVAHPDKGLLGYEQFGMLTVQYWRSFDHLERFAKDTDDPHLEAWRTYWKRVGKEDRTGIWHETYLVRAGQYEAVYGNMPTIGLAKASEAVTVADSVHGPPTPEGHHLLAAAQRPARARPKPTVRESVIW